MVGKYQTVIISTAHGIGSHTLTHTPQTAPSNMFTDYAKATDKIKLYVRRVFITDNFEDMMPKYLNFVRGVVSHMTGLSLYN